MSTYELDLTGLDNSAELKSCCAAVYESDWARLLLGDSFHPGGIALTKQLGEQLNLHPAQKVLDVASGSGSSAIFLAQQFGVDVTGIDYGRSAVTKANIAAAQSGVADLVRFEVGDAEQLPFPGSSFDAVICECALCTFPDKPRAADQIYRVLKPGGQLGLSDLTRSELLPPELDSLLAWIACIADALPIEDYQTILESAGLSVDEIVNHDEALLQTVADVRRKILGAELLVKLKKVDLPGADFQQARKIARGALTAVQEEKLGYTLLTATK